MKKPHEFPIDLADFIGEYKLKIVDKPFRYVVIDGLFKKDFYDALCKEFDTRLSLGLSEKTRKDRFSRFGHYDAYCWTINFEQDVVFSNLLFCNPWRQFVNSFFKLPLNSNTLAEFHYHKTESKPGYIHNDYDIVGFTNSRLRNGVNPWYYQCKYMGAEKRPDVMKSVRSIACLYYFNNAPWAEGDGGETALFESYGENAQPVDTIAPINNRLLVFQISPKSFHAFRQNKAIRNCFAQWFHMDKRVAIDYYGEKPNKT